MKLRNVSGVVGGIVACGAVHKDVSTRLRAVSPGLFAQVQAVLARNKAERHLRGGAATRRKYQHSP